jgi:hypothetical protein
MALYSRTDFSRDVEKVILRLSLSLIFSLTILISLRLLIMSLWKKSRIFVALGLPVKSQIRAKASANSFSPNVCMSSLSGNSLLVLASQIDQARAASNLISMLGLVNGL